MTRKRPNQSPAEETTIPKTISKKDFINSVIKKKQRSKFLTENQKEWTNLFITL